MYRIVARKRGVLCIETPPQRKVVFSQQRYWLYFPYLQFYIFYCTLTTCRAVPLYRPMGLKVSYTYRACQDGNEVVNRLPMPNCFSDMSVCLGNNWPADTESEELMVANIVGAW